MPLHETRSGIFVFNMLYRLTFNAWRHSDQWRICFRWKDGDAYDVEVVDYH
jgi:hypothetical protein